MLVNENLVEIVKYICGTVVLCTFIYGLFKNI